MLLERRLRAGCFGPNMFRSQCRSVPISALYLCCYVLFDMITTGDLGGKGGGEAKRWELKKLI